MIYVTSVAPMKCVTSKVFLFIGPSDDGRRHGRGTYLFFYILLSLLEIFYLFFPLELPCLCFVESSGHVESCLVKKKKKLSLLALKKKFFCLV
jgi:hypothetical protein